MSCCRGCGGCTRKRRLEEMALSLAPDQKKILLDSGEGHGESKDESLNESKNDVGCGCEQEE